MSWSPCAEFGNGGAITPPVSAGLFGVSFLKRWIVLRQHQQVWGGAVMGWGRPQGADKVVPSHNRSQGSQGASGSVGL
jgi:hypothetical protein